MPELDTLLREAFTRAAEPGDTSGVANAIRSRVASGDTGITPEGPIFPGGGPFGGSTGLLGWLPVIGVVAIAGLVGGVIGATGVFGASEPASATGQIATLDNGVHALDCPGGAPVAQLAPGDRVLATARSEDGGYLGVRNPSDYSGTVWLPVNLVELDEPKADTLPVGGCPEAVVALATPEPAPEPEPEPAPAPGPAPAPPPPPAPGDTTKPVIQQAWVSPASINCGDQASVWAISGDNVGVTGMTVQWTATSGNGSASMTKVGSDWRYIYTSPGNLVYLTDVTFILRATDAAGNVSNPTQVNLEVVCFG